MNERLFEPEVQEFIRNSGKTDLQRLLLSKSPFPGIRPRELAVQISGREKAREKLPTWYNVTGICYPETIHLEQCSSETAAAYKARLIPEGTVIDLTSGFGVDSFYFSKVASRVHCCEKNKALATIASHNMERLGVQHAEVHCEDGLEWLDKKRPKADMMYLDPSRRTRDNKRVYQLSDAEPDVVSHLSRLFDVAPRIMVKSSPMLDIHATVAILGPVMEMHVVAINNEVKELLWLLQKGYRGEPMLHAAHLHKDGCDTLQFMESGEKNLKDAVGEPEGYLYEPNAAILKSGGFKTLGKRLGLAKLDIHTHLYTSQEPVAFPGRSFRIIRTMPYRPRAIKKGQYEQANVSTRNFPETVAGIRKQFGIKDGGTSYLFFTRSSQNGLILIECEKI